MRTIEQMCNEAGMTLDEILKIGAKQQWFWNKYVLGYPTDSKMHIEWSDMLNKYNRLCISAFTGSYKTSFFTLGMSTRNVFFNDDEGMIYSCTGPQAIRLLDRIVDLMATNELLQEILPASSKQKDRESKTELKVARGWKISVHSMGSDTKGAHPRWAIGDDVIPDNTRYSMDYIKDYWFGTVSTRVDPEDKLVLVGTPVSTDDLLHDKRIRKSEVYAFKEYPIYLKPVNKEIPRWPEKWPAARILLRRKEIGEFMFLRECLLEPIENTMKSMFPPKLLLAPEIRNTDRAFLERGEYIIDKETKKKEKIKYIIACDPAFSATGDYCAFVVAHLVDGKLIIDRLERFRGKSGKQILDYICRDKTSLAKRFPADIIVIERNSFHAMENDVENINAPIQLLDLATQKQKQEMLLIRLQSRFQNHSIEFPYKTGPTAEMVDKLFSELNSLGCKAGNIQGIRSKDDLAIALAWANEVSYELEDVGTDFMMGD